jgi:hypothetical protein
MLDDDEFQHAISLRGAGDGNLREREFAPVLAEYERVTGRKETNINAFYHHLVKLYGPPCKHCGRPLRTPEAKRCGACMRPV